MTVKYQSNCQLFLKIDLQECFPALIYHPSRRKTCARHRNCCKKSLMVKEITINYLCALSSMCIISQWILGITKYDLGLRLDLPINWWAKNTQPFSVLNKKWGPETPTCKLLNSYLRIQTKISDNFNLSLLFILTTMEKCYEALKALLIFGIIVRSFYRRVKAIGSIDLKTEAKAILFLAF